MADLKKWFYAIHLFLNDKKVISASQLQREIGVTYKTSWCMLRQIRLAMRKKKKDDEDDNDFMNIIVKIDENMKKWQSDNGRRA